MWRSFSLPCAGKLPKVSAFLFHRDYCCCLEVIFKHLVQFDKHFLTELLRLDEWMKCWKGAQGLSFKSYSMKEYSVLLWSRFRSCDWSILLYKQLLVKTAKGTVSVLLHSELYCFYSTHYLCCLIDKLYCSVLLYNKLLLCFTLWTDTDWFYSCEQLCVCFN